MICYIREKKLNYQLQKIDTKHDANVSQRTDENLTKRIEKFHDQLESTYWYRTPLKYICDIGLVNTPIKFNTKWWLTFETDMQALFESKGNQAADALPTSIDAKIILESTPYLLYYQFQLEDTFRTSWIGNGFRTSSKNWL